MIYLTAYLLGLAFVISVCRVAGDYDRSIDMSELDLMRYMDSRDKARGDRAWREWVEK